MLTQPSTTIVVLCTVLPFLDVVLVLLRLWAQGIRQQKLNIDDILIVAALVIVLASCWGYIYGAVKGGIGHHVNDVSLDQLTLFLKTIFALQFPYLASVTLIKLSILFFYQRIFALPIFVRIARTLCFVAILWFITFFFTTLFQAYPIRGNWTLGSNDDTMNQYAMYAAAGAIEIALDIVTLSMPLFVIWRLHISAREKWIISVIFLLGAFVCFASIIRLYYIIVHLGPTASEEQDLTYNLADIIIWSAVEPYVGLICACLPTLRPIFRNSHLPPILASLRTLLRSGSSQNSRLRTNEVLPPEADSENATRDAERAVQEQNRRKRLSPNALPSLGSYAGGEDEIHLVELTKPAERRTEVWET